MLKSKRIIIATILGLLSGLVCWKMASASGNLHWAIAVNIILGRTLLGFGIGISSLKFSWWMHGIIIGFIFSVPMAFATLATPTASATSGAPPAFYIFLGTMVMGVIYGVIIELITTVLFKAKQP
ncbi:MAG: hypothetical protein ACT6FF_04855 [Methanosarcinaceae archaeon]